MAYSLVGHVAAASGTGPTTAGLNTTGADLIVLHVSQFSTVSGSVSDSKSNTWTALTLHDNGSLQSSSKLYYCQAPTVGSGHTFTYSGTVSSICVEAFSGSVASPFDQENGDTIIGSVTSHKTPSVTPGADNELLVAGVGAVSSNSFAIDSGFTITDQFALSGGVNGGAAMAYLIQTTAAAESPTWSWTVGSANSSVSIATFKAAGGGGGQIFMEWLPRYG